MPELRGYHQLSLSVTDLELSTSWYGRVLALAVVAEITGSRFRWVRLRPPGDGLTLTLTCHEALAGSSFDERHPGMDHVAFDVGGLAEVEAFKARFEDLDVESSEIQHMDGGVSMITFRDPDGIQLEVRGQHAR